MERVWALESDTSSFESWFHSYFLFMTLSKFLNLKTRLLYLYCRSIDKITSGFFGVFFGEFYKIKFQVFLAHIGCIEMSVFIFFFFFIFPLFSFPAFLSTNADVHFRIHDLLFLLKYGWITIFY